MSIPNQSLHGVRIIEYTHYATITTPWYIIIIISLYRRGAQLYNNRRETAAMRANRERETSYLARGRAVVVDIYHRQGVRSFLVGRRSRRCLPRILVRALITTQYTHTHTSYTLLACTTGGCTPSDWEKRGGVRGRGSKKKRKRGRVSLWRKGGDLLILVFFFLFFFFFLKSVRRSAVPSKTKQLS